MKRGKEVVEEEDKILVTQKRYWKSKKGREAQGRYRKSGKGKEAFKRYQESEAGKLARERYYQSEKGRKARERYLDKRKLIRDFFKELESNPQLTVEEFLSQNLSINTERSSK